MREIIFRGRTLIEKKWVYGDLSYHVHENEVYVFPEDGYDSPGFYEVDPATVGQYTGLKDKNGKRIFEGDIFIASGVPKYRYVAEWEECGFAAFIDPAGFSSNDVEVIGNIHDNPELLKRAEA